MAAMAALLVAGGLVGFSSPLAEAVPAPARQCSEAKLTVHVHSDAKGSDGNQRISYIEVTNRGAHSCALRGAPGVSLIGDDGAQIGRGADQPLSGDAATVRLARGQTARVTLTSFAIDEDGGANGPFCMAVKAAGYRITPPRSTRSFAVKAPQYACANPAVTWGSVEYIGAHAFRTASR